MGDPIFCHFIEFCESFAVVIFDEEGIVAESAAASLFDEELPFYRGKGCF
jgi:hypothetical protein